MKFFTTTQVVTGFKLGLADQATINPNGNITTQGTITSTGSLSAPTIYTKIEVDNLLNQKHPLMLTTSNLAIKTLYCRYIEPPAGGDTVNINSDTVVFGATTWLRATSTLVSFYTHS